MKRFTVLAVLLGVAGVLALLGGLPGTTDLPVAEATRDPADCNPGLNAFSLAGVVSPPTVQPGQPVTLQLTLENQEALDTPCNWIGDVEIGRNGAGDCQSDGGAVEVILDDYEVLSQERHRPTKQAEAGDIANDDLQQVCTVPAGTPAGPFLIHARAQGELHSGTVHTKSGDHRDLQVNVVRPAMTVTKTCLNNPVPPGDPARFRIVVTNTSEGDVALRDVTVTDKGVAGTPFDLPNPGDFREIDHENVKSPEDLANGFITNQASVTARVNYVGAPTDKTLNVDSNLATCFNQVENPKVFKKDPTLRNLWLCTELVLNCVNSESGVQSVVFPINIDGPVTGRDPKCTGFPTFAPDPTTCPRQTIGAFEFEVRFESKYVIVDVFAGPLFQREGVECTTTRLEHAVQFRCNTKGKDVIINGPGTLAFVFVRPTPDVYSILIPNQLNGITSQLINQDCQLADLQGHPIKIALNSCNDSAVTIRYLEGDVHHDCEINVHDQQQIAFRWGSRLGSLLYNSRYDLEPSLPKKGDGDIDAKDLQLVYGRFGSTCKAPHPAQDPVDPKAKVGPAPAP